MLRKNVNRGFKSLRVWKDAVSLYILACKILTKFSFELKKVASNSIDASHSISRNIAEGYSRRSLKEYLNFLKLLAEILKSLQSYYHRDRNHVENI